MTTRKPLTQDMPVGFNFWEIMQKRAAAIVRQDYSKTPELLAQVLYRILAAKSQTQLGQGNRLVEVLSSTTTDGKYPGRWCVHCSNNDVIPQGPDQGIWVRSASGGNLFANQRYWAKATGLYKSRVVYTTTGGLMGTGLDGWNWSWEESPDGTVVTGRQGAFYQFGPPQSHVGVIVGADEVSDANNYSGQTNVGLQWSRYGTSLGNVTGTLAPLDVASTWYGYATMTGNCTLNLLTVDASHVNKQQGRMLSLFFIASGSTRTLTVNHNTGSVTSANKRISTLASIPMILTVYTDVGVLLTFEYGEDGMWHVVGCSNFVSPLTTKGDLHGFGTADDRVPVGSNGKILIADSAQTMGVGYSTRDLDAGSNKITNVTQATASGHAVAAQRTITAGVALSGGGDLTADRTIDLDITELTEDTAPSEADDFLVTYDASAGSHKKVKPGNFDVENFTFSDNTTNNSSTTKHGLLKKLSNTATEYMDGSGNWSTPTGGTGTGAACTVLGRDVNSSGTRADIDLANSEILARTSDVVNGYSLSTVLDFVGSAAQGDILYRGASDWTRLGAGTSGHFLKTQGAAANPTWAAVSAGTSIVTGSVVGSNFTTTNATATDVTGLASAGILANIIYDFICMIRLGAATLPAAGSKFAINTPATPSVLTAFAFGETTAAGAWRMDYLSADNTLGAQQYNQAIGNDRFIWICGRLANGSNAGTLQIATASNTAGQTTTICIGSWISAWAAT